MVSNLYVNQGIAWRKLVLKTSEDLRIELDGLHEQIRVLQKYIKEREE